MSAVFAAMVDVLVQTWRVLVEAAPWLVFGLFAAGLVKWALPERRLVRLMGRRSATQVWRATVVGAPLPLCSCGVLPAALGLRREGLSKAGTSSFLVATPQNGVDSIALSYALLGPVFTVVRVLTSLVSSVAAGFATLALDRSRGMPQGDDGSREVVGADGACCGGVQSASVSAAACCDGEANESATAATSAARCSSLAAMPMDSSASRSTEPGDDAGSCCHSASSHNARDDSPTAACCGADEAIAEHDRRATFVSGQRYAFGSFLVDIGGWLMIGLFVAGAMNAFVGPQGLSAFGSGLLPMLAVLLLSIPMYICASASTPIAASMLVAGVSPGVVLVFLLAGPATNFAGVALIRRDLGTRATAGYLGGLIVCTFALGLLADLVLLRLMDWSPTPLGEGRHHLIPAWLGVAAAVGLLVRLGGLHVQRLFGWFAASRGGAASRRDDDGPVSVASAASPSA
jgi:hypothetical protein